MLSATLLATLATLAYPDSNPPFVPQALSPFDQRKAEALLRERLPCLGCHELDGSGGHIGPSLDALRGARPADYVYRVIRDPQGTRPGTIMPRVPMSAATLELVASYLVARPPTPPPSTAPAPGAVSPAPASGGGEPASLYQRSCAPCHGTGGGGNGYNAQFLPVRPTAHADSAYMTTRSDDELFDTIFAGGYVMNRSNRMPPFGQTLTREQIWTLVRYLRTLCRCREPAWAHGS